MLNEILVRGYLPQELPPPFSSASLAAAIAKLPALPLPFGFAAPNEPNYKSRPVSFSVARRGSLRRSTSIPNPINYCQLASLIASEWAALQLIWSKSKSALSTPTATPFGERAIGWTFGFGALPYRRANVRAGARYLLVADIKGCFPSMYTHSISWALHTKKTAKKDFSFYGLLGNRVDTLIRNGNDGQTKGIPIGPDTSLAAAELILSAVDERIQTEVSSKYLRYMDDFEFGCRTFSEAESVMARLQEMLAEYELGLNEVKTKIRELPCALEAEWVRGLRERQLRPKYGQDTALIAFFDLAIKYWSEYPDEAVIKYAILKAGSTYIRVENWQLFQELLAQWVVAEPGTIDTYLDILRTYQKSGWGFDKDILVQTLHTIISAHSLRGHSSEVAWAIWGCLLFDLPLDDSATKAICGMDDPIVGLMACDAKARKLLSAAADMGVWKNHMEPEQLKDTNWLVAYEARLKKWLPIKKPGAKDYVSTADGFKDLKAWGVKFYDEKLYKSYEPSSMKLQILLSKLTSAAY